MGYLKKEQNEKKNQKKQSKIEEAFFTSQEL